MVSSHNFQQTQAAHKKLDAEPMHTAYAYKNYHFLAELGAY